MSSRSSSGVSVRRFLSFDELPYRGKRFYLDVRKAADKTKLAQHILYLGGAVEDFLSKELSLIITDRDSGKADSTKPVKAQIPLSRGQALLKASQHQGPKDGHVQDFLQSAANLGVKTEKASTFSRATSKLYLKIKTRRKACNDNDLLEGMSPISWDKDKENVCLVKVEDNENVYRPLFKQFEAFPEVDYSQPASPFDVGVVLKKEGKENNQVKKKSAGAGVVKGGFCESCDHWYKCSLREHLKSDKHRAFVKSVDNFRSLDDLVVSLPNLRKFLGKNGLSCEIDSQTASPTLDHTLLTKLQTDVASSNGASLSQVECTPSVSKAKDEQCSSRQLPDCVSSHSEGGILHRAESRQSSNQVSQPNILDQFEKAKCTSESNSEKAVSKTDKTVSSERRLTLNEVLQDVFDVDNIANDSLEDENKETTHFYQIKNSDNAFKQIKESGVLSQASKQLTNIDADLRPASSDQCASLSNVLQNSGFLRHVPEASFSSSCSFGDNGIGHIISYLHNKESSSTCSSVQETNEVSGKCSNTEDKPSLSSCSDNVRFTALPSSQFHSSCKKVDAVNFMTSFSENGCDNRTPASVASQCSNYNQMNLAHAVNFMTNFGQNDSSKQASGSAVSQCSYSSHMRDDSNSSQSRIHNSRALSQHNTRTGDDSRGVESFIKCFEELPNVLSELSSTVRYPLSGHTSVMNLSKPASAKGDSDINSVNSFDCKPTNGGAYLCGSNCNYSDLHVDNSPLCQSVATGMSNENVETPEKLETPVACNDETPTRKSMSFMQPSLEDLCRSGSSVRNWLIPKGDDEVSVKTVVSKLNDTLIEMGNSPTPHLAAKPATSVDGAGQAICSDSNHLPKSINTGVCDLVANWIQTQEFNQSPATEKGPNVVKAPSCDSGTEGSLKHREPYSVAECDSLSLGVRSKPGRSVSAEAAASSVTGHGVSAGQAGTLATDSSSYTSISDCTVFSNMDTTQHIKHTGKSVNAGDNNDLQNTEMCVNREDDKHCSKRALEKHIKPDGVPNLNGDLEHVEIYGHLGTQNSNAMLKLENNENASTGSVRNDHLLAGGLRQYWDSSAVMTDKSRGAGDCNTYNRSENTATDNNRCATMQGMVTGKPDAQSTASSQMEPQVRKETSKRATKQKAAKKPKPAKKAETKKKVSQPKQSQKLLGKAGTVMQITPALSQSPGAWQTPYMAQLMYSPISLPSENAPADPASPYAPQLGHNITAYPAPKSLPHTDIGSPAVPAGQSHSRAFSPALHTAYIASAGQVQGEAGCTGPYGWARAAGLSQPYTPTAPGYSSLPVPANSSCNQQISSTIPVPGTRPYTPHVLNVLPVPATATSYSSTAVPSQQMAGRQQVAAGYHGYEQSLSVDTSYRGGQLIDLLASPLTQGPTLYNNSQQQAVTSQPRPSHSASHSENNFTSLEQPSHKSSRISNDYSEVENHNQGQYSVFQYPNSSQTALTTRSYVTAAVAGSGCVIPQPYQVGSYSRHSLPSPGAPPHQPATESLSTIRLSDIAEDASSNYMYTDNSRYVARPKPTTSSTVPNMQQTKQNDVVQHSDRAMQMSSRTDSGMPLSCYSSVEPDDAMSSFNTSCGQSYDSGSSYQYPAQAQRAGQATAQTQGTNTYNAVQTGAMKLRLCKQQARSWSDSPEPKSTLPHYWNVRKTGECRLVFSTSQVCGKRKAGESPGEGELQHHADTAAAASPYQPEPDLHQQQAKRRRCLVF